MDYFTRHSEDLIAKLSSQFSALLVTGPRQVGKTTLLQNCTSGIEYITFDNPMLVTDAKDNPSAFLQMHEYPCVLDEVQYVTGLFPYIKMMVDTNQKKGMYYLTGSQQFHLMKDVSESLAGRVGIVNLQGLSMRERERQNFREKFLPTLKYITNRKRTVTALNHKSIWHYIYSGSFPAVATGTTPDNFYPAYIKTYLERDVRALTQVGDESQFAKFIAVVAARTAQVLNYKELANEVGISEPTAKKWLSILITSGLVYILQPYYTNIGKRATKTPKMYFLDTGLACYLTRWTSAEVLEQGAMAGAFFETFVISEILKGYYNQGVIDPPMYFYRDKDAKEIDLIIEENGTLYPIEIKKTSNPNKHDIRHFAVLDNIGTLKIGSGCIVCMSDTIATLGDSNYVVPVNYL